MRLEDLLRVDFLIRVLAVDRFEAASSIDTPSNATNDVCLEAISLGKESIEEHRKTERRANYLIPSDAEFFVLTTEQLK